MNFGDGYVIPSFLDDGMEVFIRFVPPGVFVPVALKCTVLVAAGDAGRIVCEKYGIDRWVHRYNLRIFDPNYLLDRLGR